MHPIPFPVAVFTAVAVVAGIASTTVGARVATSRPLVAGIVAAASPGLFMLAMFYSLAINMHHTLGGWPESIGTRGFPDQLIAHADLAGDWFFLVILTSLFAWPVAFAVCLAYKRWRHCLLHLGVFAFSMVVCAVGIIVAPAGFANWWWD